MKHRSSVLALHAAVLMACGSSDPFVAAPEPDGADCALESGRLLPLSVGSSWTHQRTRLKSGAVDEKTQSVQELLHLGEGDKDVMTFRLVTDKESGSTVRFFEDTGTAVLSHRKQDLAGATHHDEYFVDSKIRVDESAGRLAEGDSYSETYTEVSTNLTTGDTTMRERRADWTVHRHGEEVSVPAGTFCTVRLGRVVTTEGKTGSEKLYWYAPGIGKVKERDGNKLEELVEHQVP